MPEDRNVLGEKLETCSIRPMERPLSDRLLAPARGAPGDA